MIKRNVLYVSIFLFIFFIFSCDNPAGKSSTQNAELIGTWDLDGNSLTFNADGSGYEGDVSRNKTFTWHTPEKGVVHFDYTNGSSIRMRYTLHSGNKISLEFML